MAVEWIINKEHEGMAIREFLRDIQSFSRRMVVAIKFDGGEILVNDRPQTVRYCLTAGDRLVIKLPREKKGYYMKPEKIPLNILYEDDDIIVLYKEAGIATIPSPHQPSGTIANGLLAYYEEKGLTYTIHVVTRLDRDTSGLLLIAKHRHSHSLLARSQKEGRIDRSYQAIIEGSPEAKNGTIMANIGRKEGSIIERTVTLNGKRAITHYKTITEMDLYTLVDVRLETGRTHQIRVHFAHIGHPIVGDNLYGGKRIGIGRQALHCRQIRFEHPITKKEMSFTAKLPDDMQKLLG